MDAVVGVLVSGVCGVLALLYPAAACGWTWEVRRFQGGLWMMTVGAALLGLQRVLSFEAARGGRTLGYVGLLLMVTGLILTASGAGARGCDSD